ncbi:SDR family NAD(P)-dependent oxidoreductase [Cytobacillus sp. IB215316]|uniref:SDR family NAD(P)-dependent oxidoreductase n=1 Tax=Cytobacillus sp. IB215316 TaxID=3097354 RepID=UPI002A0BCDB3|nr:SDR family NAD(P)-dependent oxidoreductase [Cytobacillus sp. IB215316]MDX8363495.1 SDR family NAD(P)-dependent oxidoreductase [Cytobacillus sp. IB215316]
MRFNNKVAFITGGGSGVGEYTAYKLAHEGAKVVVVGRTKKKLDKVVSKIVDDGGNAKGIQCDVSDAESLKKAVDETVCTYGKLDFAVNNAGVNQKFDKTADLTVEEYKRVTGIVYDGIYYSMKAEIPHMLNNGSGSIVNVTSVYGKKGMVYNLAYSAGKHGGHGMTKTTALEYAEENIRVNTVLPGVIDTPLLKSEPEAVERIRQGIPIKRLGKPHEVANAICFLLSDEASYITGTELTVDGGFLI